MAKIHAYSRPSGLPTRDGKQYRYLLKQKKKKSVYKWTCTVQSRVVGELAALNDTFECSSKPLLCEIVKQCFSSVIHELEGERRCGVARMSFRRPFSQVRVFSHLWMGVLLLLNYLSFSPSLCTLKERSSTCRTEKEAANRLYSRD